MRPHRDHAVLSRCTGCTPALLDHRRLLLRGHPERPVHPVTKHERPGETILIPAYNEAAVIATRIRLGALRP